MQVKFVISLSFSTEGVSTNLLRPVLLKKLADAERYSHGHGYAYDVYASVLPIRSKEAQFLRLLSVKKEGDRDVLDEDAKTTDGDTDMHVIIAPRGKLGELVD